MKTQLKKELHAKTDLELASDLNKRKEELRAMKLDKEMGKLKNTSSLRQAKVEIAVIKTIMNEKIAKAKTIVRKKEVKNE